MAGMGGPKAICQAKLDSWCSTPAELSSGGLGILSTTVAGSRLGRAAASELGPTAGEVLL